MEQWTKEQKEFLEEKVRREAVYADQFTAKGEHPITALVKASDLAGRDMIHEKWLKGELDWKTAMIRMGSYARFEWFYDRFLDGTIPARTFYKMLPGEWVSADVNDRDPRYSGMWETGWRRNGRRYLRDVRFKRLPKPDFIPEANQGNPVYRVYRGTGVGKMHEHCLSWSLSKEVAERFAKGASAGMPKEGDVIEGLGMKKDIWAYLTERGEEEVIIDASHVFMKEIVGMWRKARKYG